MSKMTVNVEFLAGTNIKTAIEEAKKKAAFWDVAYVCFKFNDVDCSIGATADIEEACNEYASNPKCAIVYK